MPLETKTLEELLDYAKGEQHPTPLERELIRRLEFTRVQIERAHGLGYDAGYRAAKAMHSIGFGG